MHSFKNDYSEGAHPQILKALVETNEIQSCGYGEDEFSKEAADLIRSLCQDPNAQIHFMVGGTQANMTVIQVFLHCYESVIAVNTGHISVHEAGAIEATGHKVCTVDAPDGKMTPALIEKALKAHKAVHMVYPRLVYISDTTELGTIYTKAELTALHDYCRSNNLYIFMDGARLASALTAEGNDLTLADLARLTDAFTIGGTKNGLLFGEAVVLTSHIPMDRFQHFRWQMKQRGALLAKGRLLGVQFKTLLSNDLYFEIGRHANRMATKLRDGLAELGFTAAVRSDSNQQFIVMPNTIIQKLNALGYDFETDFAGGPDLDDEHSYARFVTDWSTPEDAVDELLADVKKICQTQCA